MQQQQSTSWNLRESAARLVLELGPAVLFFAATKWLGIFAGTIALMVGGTVATAVSWVYARRIPILPLAGLALTLVFGGLTLWWHEDDFIKVQPTLVNGISALVLTVALVFGRLPLKSIFGAGTHARDRAWRRLTLALVVFLVCLAAANEVLWRETATDVWAAYKAFVIPALDGLFVFAAYKYLRSHSLDPRDRMPSRAAPAAETAG